MSVDGDDKDLQDLTYLHDGKQICQGGIVSEGQGLHEEEKSTSNVKGIAEQVKDGQGGSLEAQNVLQIPMQQPQGAMICWERFLHLRSLKVLLVENDDSTRHIVTALLRNCSYEVIEAANGLQAWKILEDLTSQIDIVLTEVVMPCISGIGLLCKIMSHKTRKNIPVIMMSSHDSMGLVFKCLSKGAVDFLVKPIRKNELKNLWQHVWRRCHSSSGSGSESGTQTQKSVKLRSLEKSGNNTGSNDEDDNGSIGLNVGDGSDNGSGTQSSWTKQAVEVDSPRVLSPLDQVAECPDSTCAQVVHSNVETSGNKLFPGATIKEGQEEKDEPEQNRDMRRDLDMYLEYEGSLPIKVAVIKQNNPLDVGCSKVNEKINRRELDLNHESPSSKPQCKEANLTNIPNTSNPLVQGGEVEIPNRLCKISSIDKNSAFEEPPSIELSLKRLRGVESIGIVVHDNRNVLRRSDLSAFSRYNATSNTKKSPTGNVGSNSPHDNSLEVTKKDSSHDIQSHSSGIPPNQNSNGASNNIDMGSTTNNAYTKSAVVNEPAVASPIKSFYPTSAFQPLKINHICAAQQVLSHDNDDMMATLLAQPRGVTHKDSPMQYNHHYENHHSHHIANNIQGLPSDHNEMSLKKMVAAIPQSGSTNVSNLNCSANGSASGSNNGSNGQHGSSAAVNAEGANKESNNRVSGNAGCGDASGSGSGSANRVELNKMSQREAALNKFRQKRKDRCFRKKVRYQSRKRLAEQRPRFRGQFVRQSASESQSSPTDS